jgi:hypothetical protein
VIGLPVFLPEDPAIPAKETPAPERFERQFVFDKKNLQREQKDDVPSWLTLAAYLAVLGLAVGLVTALTIALRRVERTHLDAPAEV